MDPKAQSLEHVPPNPFPHEFSLIRLLGAGAFGTVWLANDLQLLRPVAIKTFDARALDERADHALICLRNEAQLLATIKHPNLVTVHAWRTAGSENYLILQYVSGGSLADWVKRDGKLPWELAGRCIADVGDALMHIHQRGIVHRDVKPANILWDFDTREAILADFGISTRLSGNIDAAGTPAFMAPEAYSGTIDPALDMYSLAATFFFLLTGKVPFSGKQPQDIRSAAVQGLAPVDARFAQTPEPIEQWIRAGLQADCKLRPALGGAVSQLRGILNQLLVDVVSSRALSPTVSAISAVASTSAPKSAAEASALHLRVSRLRQDGSVEALSQTAPPQPRMLRDLKRVPSAPQQVRLKTGDQVRFELMSELPGYVSVINVGPTGNLHLLYPDTLESAHEQLVAKHWMHLLDVELSPPAGRERIMAIWSDRPEPLLTNLLNPGHAPDAYRATRVLARLAESVESGGGDRRVSWLELNHVPAN